MSQPLNILALSPRPLSSLEHGVGMRAYHLLRRLSGRHAVTLAHFPAEARRPKKQLDVGRVRLLACEPPASSPTRGLTRARRAVSLGSPYAFSDAMWRTARSLLSSQRFDLVLTFHATMLPYAFAASDVPVVADLIDEPTLAAWRNLRQARDPIEAARLVRRILALVRYERALCSRADRCLVTAEADARSLRRVAPSARVEVLANGVEQADPRPPAGPPEPYSLMFSGNMNFPPNVCGVRHFHRQVLPLIAERCPRVRWYVVGADPAPEVQQLATDPRVTVTGWVEDLRPYFERSAVVVSPLVSGGGIKNKVLEAWAMGKAVVATPLGCAGVRARPGENILLARTPRELAAATLDLLAHPERAAALGEAGRRTVREHHSWDRQAAGLEDLLQRVHLESSRALGTSRWWSGIPGGASTR